MENKMKRNKLPFRRGEKKRVGRSLLDVDKRGQSVRMTGFWWCHRIHSSWHRRHGGSQSIGTERIETQRQEQVKEMKMFCRESFQGDCILPGSEAVAFLPTGIEKFPSTVSTVFFFFFFFSFTPRNEKLFATLSQSIGREKPTHCQRVATATATHLNSFSQARRFLMST